MGVVLLSDGRSFKFSSFSFSLFLLHSPSFSPSRSKFSYSVSPFTFDCFLLFLRLVRPPSLGAFTFPVGYFAPPLRLLCSVSSATLPRFFSYLAPSLRVFSAFFSELCPFLSGSLGRFCGRATSEEKKMAGGPARKSLRMRLSGARKVQADLAPKIIGLAVE